MNRVFAIATLLFTAISFENSADIESVTCSNADFSKSFDIVEGWNNPHIQPHIEQILRKTLVFHDDVLSKLLYHRFLSDLDNQVSSDNIYINLRKEIDDYDRSNGGKGTSAIQKRRQDRNVYLAHEIVDILSRENRIYNSYLDIGCGSGDMMTLVAEQMKIPENSLYGLELAQQQEPNRKINFIYYDGIHFPENIPQVSLITLVNVLHHLEDTEKVHHLLHWLYNSLEPEGTLLIRDHDITNHNGVQLMRIKHRLFEKVIDFFSPEMAQDKLYLSSQTWYNLLTEHGFKLVSEKKIETDPTKPFYALFRKLEM